MKERIFKAVEFGLTTLLMPYALAVRIFRPAHFHEKVAEYKAAEAIATMPEGLTLDEVQAHFEAQGFDVEIVRPPAMPQREAMIENARWN
jgi:hypothetical protein